MATPIKARRAPHQWDLTVRAPLTRELRELYQERTRLHREIKKYENKFDARPTETSRSMLEAMRLMLNDIERKIVQAHERGEVLEASTG